MTTIAEHIWETKYRCRDGDGAPDATLDDTWRRIANAVAAREKDPDRWRDVFFDALASLRFLPGGRIIAGAGTGKRVTLFNCFAAGQLEDSLDGILDSLKDAALTMQQGGGIGCDFSSLRPLGSPAVGSGAIASGPVSFMHVWDALCATLLSTSTRRGAMMATLRCDHPDIEAFIDAKVGGDVLRNFNLSVLVTDAFMRAVSDDADWPLVFPSPLRDNELAGESRVYKRVSARGLWERIARSACASAEPGILFVDNINRDNNLYYREYISTTNPCGEIPLPPHGACDLGSINLPRFVRKPFTDNASIDEGAIAATVKVAVRFLDDVIDVSGFPLPEQASQAKGSRRVGLGITGLADALIMCGLRYDSDEGRDTAARIMQLIRDHAYDTSIRLAAEKGPFPFLNRTRYLEAPFVKHLPEGLRSKISVQGIRNSHLLAIAPTGTISLLAGNVSSGIEPVFALDALREVRNAGGVTESLEVRDFAYARWLGKGGRGRPLPDAFATAEELSPEAHLKMQACVQPFVDNAISKTVNLPLDATTADVLALYSKAYELGIKGCTIYRSGSLSGQVLKALEASRCCYMSRAS